MYHPSKLNEEHPDCMMAPPPVSQQFCLKWNDHSSNLVKSFSVMAFDQNFVDVTLACEGSFIKAHRVVLSACSNYFKELFLSNPFKHPIVILKDMKMDDLKAIVDFMYKGEVNVYQHQLGALLKTAEVLKVKGLTDAKDEDDENKLNQDMREMDKENEPVNNELPRTGVDHSSILNENDCQINGVSSQQHYQQHQIQTSLPLSAHLAPQQHPIQLTQQQSPLPQQITAQTVAQIQTQMSNTVQPHTSLNQQQQQQQPLALSLSLPPAQTQQQPPPQLHQSPQTHLKHDTEMAQQIQAEQIIQQQQQQQQHQQHQQQQQQQQHQQQQHQQQQHQQHQQHQQQQSHLQQPSPQQQKQSIQPHKRRRRRSKRSVDSSSVDEGSASDDASVSASGDDDSASGDNSMSKRLKAPVPLSQGNSSSLDNSNHSLTSRRRQPLALPPPPPPPIMSQAIQSHREIGNNSDYGHLDDSSETWQDNEQISMNNPIGDASEESNGMIDIKPIVSFDEGSVGASMNNMSVSSENMIVSHMDYSSLSPGSTGSMPSNASNTGKVCRCQHCGLTFTAYSSLRRHMQRHFADRERYVCDICLKSYSRKDYLKEHKKLKHPT